jgi:hypothetical protein
MLYLLGGASRAGKSTLARRLLIERSIAYFSLDVLVMGLTHGLPQLGVDSDAPSQTRAEQLWPLIRAMCQNLLEEATVHPSYLLEGDILLPHGVAELVSEHPSDVRACFIGYTGDTPEVKLREVRQCDPEWYTWAAPEEVLAFLNDMVEYSRYLASECLTRGLPYVDGSTDLDGALCQAYRHLVGQ